MTPPFFSFFHSIQGGLSGNKINQFYPCKKKIVTAFCKAFLEFYAVFIGFLQNKTVKLKEIYPELGTDCRSQQ